MSNETLNLTKKMDQVFSDPFASVDIQPVAVAGEEIASKIAVRVKADDGTWSRTPAVLSSGYNLLQNSVVKDVGDDIMSRSGHEWRPLKRYWDGRKFIDMHITNAPITQVDGGNSPHPIHLGLMLRNSYDGSSVFGVELYACNMVCTNQYHDRNRFGYFAIRHSGEGAFDVNDAVANIGAGANNIIAIAPKLNQMRLTDLTIQHLVDAQKSTEVSTPRWGDVLEQLGKEPDMGTLYGLFQALTFVATHQVGGMKSLKVSESVGNYFLK
jgi:hypothetical protein